VGVPIDPEHLRTTPGQLEAIESGIAADVEDLPASQIHGEMRGKLLPFPARKVAEVMFRKGLDSVRKMDVVKPRTQALDVVLDILFIHQVTSSFSRLGIWGRVDIASAPGDLRYAA
jgi:hypothetical protein